jgi:Sigma-70 region 2
VLLADAALGSVPADAQPGADQAITAIYSTEYRSLVRLAAVLVGDVGIAEEVVQDSFVAMYGAWSRLRDRDKALAYLRQRVINRSRAGLPVGTRRLRLLSVMGFPAAFVLGWRRSGLPAGHPARRRSSWGWPRRSTLSAACAAHVPCDKPAGCQPAGSAAGAAISSLRARRRADRARRVTSKRQGALTPARGRE